MMINPHNKPIAFFLENNPFHFAPLQFIPIEETFVPVTEKIVPGIKPFYWISNYGNLYSTYKGGLIRPGIDTKGYPYAALSTTKGPKNMRIHRLVLMSFSYFEGCEHEIINHSDGIKTHAWVWNLEWSTFSANQIHAYNMGLVSRIKSNRIMSTEDILKICELLMENKFTCGQIANMFNTTLDMIYSIKNKRAYCDLTSDYNFPQTNQIFSDSAIDNICYILSTYIPDKQLDYMNIREKTDYYKFICEKAGIKYCQQSVDLIRRLYKHQSFTHISNKYNF